MKKLAIFDFDGTLFDSVCDVVKCFNETLAIHGFPILTYDEYIERLGGNIDEIVSLILKDKNTPENIEKVKKTYDGIYSKSPKENTKPFDGVCETLEKLQKKGILIAINSNRKNDSISYYAEKFLPNINFFQIEGHDPVFPSKPHPGGVKRIIEHANVNSEEVIYVGDSKTDLKTAKNANVDCILVEWGYGFGNIFDDDYILGVIGDISEILNYF